MGISISRALVYSSLVVVLIIGWSREAVAQIPPLQVQLIAVGTSHYLGEEFSLEAQANLAIYGVGIAVGLGGEGLQHDDGHYDGAANFHLAVQIRPMMFFALIREYPRPIYQIFDPHIDVGGFAGVIVPEEGAGFRGVFYIGGAFDFAIPLRFYRMDSQIVLSIGYRWVAAQMPAGPQHHITFGVGWRGGL